MAFHLAGEWAGTLINMGVKVWRCSFTPGTPWFSQLTPRLLSGTFRDFQRLKLQYDELLSSFAIDCNPRRYSAGTAVLTRGPLPCFWRAPTDNDRGGAGMSYDARWRAAGLHRLAPAGGAPKACSHSRAV